MSHRFDFRSKDEFKRDIKSSTITERELFMAWLDLLEKDTGTRPVYKDTGCGKDGEFLEDNQVSADPDFYVEGYGNIEVKFSKKILTDKFHLKVSQINQYQKKNTTILMINGANEDTPTFTMLKPEALNKISETCEQVSWSGFGNKMSFKIPVSMFIWRALK